MHTYHTPLDLVRDRLPERPVALARPDAVAAAARWFQENFKGDVFYAVKANPSPWVIEALANVKDGWMEGAGKAPARADAEWLADQLVVSFPADLAFPFVCPTPTGGAFLEWSLGDWIVSAEFPLPERRCELQATNTKTTETLDEDQALNESADFTAVYEFVRRFV